MKRTWTFITLIITLPILLFLMVSWYQRKFEELPVLGPPAHEVRDFSGTSHRGAAIDENTVNGEITVMNVFFTHCPIVCPTMMKGLQEVQARFPDVHLISFSIDPERDDVARLKDYAERFRAGENWHLVTGSKPDIYRFARKGLLLLASDGDGGESDFIHSENLVLIDRQKRIRGYYKGTDQSQIDLLINDIQKLKKE